MIVPPTTQQATVRSRIKPGQWVIVAIFVGMGLAWLPLMANVSPGDTEQRIGGYLMLSFCLVPAAGFAAWLLITEIVADAQGLSWRDFRGRHSVSWEDVTDYYELPTKGGSNTALRCAVETRAGTFEFGASGWTNAQALQALVQQNATQARTNVWKLLGEREREPLPRTFDYDTADNRFQRRLAIISVVFFSGVSLWLLRRLPSTFITLGWGWGLASLGLELLTIIPLVVVSGIAVRQMTDTRSHWRKQITVTDEGLTFENTGQGFSVAWLDIIEYRIDPMRIGYRYVIITRTGEHDFLPTVSQASVLCHMITRYATAAKTTEWRSSEDDVIGGKASRWSSGCEGVGERIYHYRSRSLRAILLFPTVLAFVPVLMSPLASLGLTAKPNVGLNIVLCSLALWVWWRYYMAAIQVDASGITERAIFGPRRLRWEQVERFYISGSDAFKFGNVVGAGTRIRFWIGIADVEELKVEIARRAVSSRNRTWDEAGLTAARDR